MLPRIPKSARIAVADALAQRITSAVSDGTPEAWKALLCFAYAVLRAPDSRRDKSSRKSLASVIRHNIATADDNVITNAIPPRFDGAPRTHNAAKGRDLSRRVASKLADGDVRGALRALTSDDSFAAPTSEVVAHITDKHPEPPSDLRDLQPPAEDTVTHIASEADVLRAINSFPPSSSAGMDGIRPAHLRSLVARSVSEAGARLLTALTALANLALSGQIPDFAVQAFYGASLIALRKPGGGLRPIAIGSVFRRVAAKVAVASVSARVGAELRPAQLGVATRNGCEAVVHAVRAYVTDAASSSQNTVIVKLDVTNAFNSVRRDAMLEAARVRLPSIYPLVWQAYCSASPLYIGDKKIWSRTGIQQGDPLSSLLFSLAIDSVSTGGGTDINVWYLDDGTIGGPLEQVTNNIQRIKNQLDEKGLTINSSKCEAALLGAVTPSSRSDAIRTLQKYLPDIREVQIDELQLLGSPICDAQVRTQLLSGAQMVRKLVSRVQELDEPHQAFFLLKNYISAPRLLYMLRSAPAYRYPAILSKIDELVRRGATAITNVDLHGDSWRQATLPVSLCGLGVRMVSDLALPAYLASLRSSASLTSTVNPHSTSLHQPDTTLLELWRERTAVDPPEEQQQSRQRAWDRAAATMVANQLLEASSTDADRARLRAAA